MERQAGLGRSLEDVLDSMTPVEAEPTSGGRAMFEPEDLEQQLDQLMGDIRDLRERVQHLVGMVPDDAMADARASGKPKKPKKSKKSKREKSHDAKDKSGKKANTSKQAKNAEHAGSRNGSAPRRTR